MLEELVVSTEIHFCGPAQVYLEGAGALELAGPVDMAPVTYYVAGPESAILIHDFRTGPQDTARGVLSGSQDESEFAKAFSQVAWIEVNAGDRGAEIRLYDCIPQRKQKDCPTLWLGVMEHDWSPFGLAGWEFLKPVGEKMAFAALLD